MSTNAETWSARSDLYSDREGKASIGQATGRGVTALLSLVESLKPFDHASKVLDSGAGTGVLTKQLTDKGLDMTITAADVAPGMLAQLDKRNLPNTKTLVLDASKDHISQGLQPDFFTHAVSSFMIQFIPNPENAINEMYRVTQPNGVTGVAIWEKNFIGDPWDIACKNLKPSYDSHGFGDLVSIKTAEDQEAALQKAGFLDIKSSKTEVVLDFGSAEEFADYFLYSRNPPFIAMQRTWGGDIEDVKEELIKVTREQFENGKIWMLAASTVGRKPAI